MMTRQQARDMHAAFTAIGGFSKIQVEFRGGFRDEYTSEDDAAELWQLNLWSANGRAGNNNLEAVKTYTAKASDIKAIARAAKGKATDKDRETLSRIASERANLAM